VKLTAVKPERLHMCVTAPEVAIRAFEAFRMRIAVPEKLYSILECA